MPVLDEVNERAAVRARSARIEGANQNVGIAHRVEDRAGHKEAAPVHSDLLRPAVVRPDDVWLELSLPDDVATVQLKRAHQPCPVRHVLPDREDAAAVYVEIERVPQEKPELIHLVGVLPAV